MNSDLAKPAIRGVIPCSSAGDASDEAYASFGSFKVTTLTTLHHAGDERYYSVLQARG